ncbi:unnamed protein product [Paramecium sonneborni]|uniref:Uncharacterized protein n=1 Tax=Paramecium sonneborni TaxID=65129 RepID=A0A8S1Q026_9CILI|nr:unnamed protein product [Paramecium sonneborni]
MTAKKSNMKAADQLENAMDTKRLKIIIDDQYQYYIIIIDQLNKFESTISSSYIKFYDWQS